MFSMIQQAIHVLVFGVVCMESWMGCLRGHVKLHMCPVPGCLHTTCGPHPHNHLTSLQLKISHGFQSIHMETCRTKQLYLPCLPWFNRAAMFLYLGCYAWEHKMDCFAISCGPHPHSHLTLASHTKPFIRKHVETAVFEGSNVPKNESFIVLPLAAFGLFGHTMWPTSSILISHWPLILNDPYGNMWKQLYLSCFTVWAAEALGNLYMNLLL